MSAIQSIQTSLNALKKFEQQKNCVHYFERVGKQMRCIHCDLLAEF